MTEELDPKEPQDAAQVRVLLKAMADPLRSRLLMTVADAQEGGVTIRQISQKVGEPLRRVRYHLDTMVTDGLVAVVGERKRRGVLERFYRVERPVLLSDEELGTLTEEDFRKLAPKAFAQVLKAIIADAGRAVAEGTFATRPGQAIARIPGEVDPQGWEELGAIHKAVARQVQAVLEEAGSRIGSDTERGVIRVLSAIMFFELPPRAFEQGER
jgi:DNA-binding transcriptional ArsR family regulator